MNNLPLTGLVGQLDDLKKEQEELEGLKNEISSKSANVSTELYTLF